MLRSLLLFLECTNPNAGAQPRLYRAGDLEQLCLKAIFSDRTSAASLASQHGDNGQRGACGCGEAEAPGRELVQVQVRLRLLAPALLRPQVTLQDAIIAVIAHRARSPVLLSCLLSCALKMPCKRWLLCEHVIEVTGMPAL